jgi:altronate dehydratase large subunit
MNRGKSGMEFMGYRRPDGSIGTRNCVGIFSTVLCANEVATDIARAVDGAVSFTHNAGCCELPTDTRRTEDVLIGLGCNPNVHSVILVSLGCESTLVPAVAGAIRSRTGKRVETVIIQESGGSVRATGKAVEIARELVAEAEKQKREPCRVADLVLGLKCGASDTTSGLVPNPAIGICSDRLVAEGGTSILGEVTEFIGAEHILARHAASEHVASQIIGLVQRMETRVKAAGEDMRGGQPTEGNIKGGLTTIEEKSLGAITKAGTAPIVEVCEYGVRPSRKGLIVMDSPGREGELLTGMAAAGCSVIAFSTGRGAPQGFPFVPVIKITGSRTAATRMADHIDLDISGVLDGELSLPDAGGRIFQDMLEVANGRVTKAELTGYTNTMSIYTTGPVI